MFNLTNKHHIFFRKIISCVVIILIISNYAEAQPKNNVSGSQNCLRTNIAEIRKLGRSIDKRRRDSAKEEILQLIRIAKASRDTLMLVKAICTVGIIASIEDDLTNFKWSSDSSLFFALRFQNSEALSEAYYISAGYLMYSKSWPNAWENFLKAEYYALKSPETSDLFSVYFGMSQFMEEIGNDERQKKYLMLAQKFASDYVQETISDFKIGVTRLNSDPSKAREMICVALERLGSLTADQYAYYRLLVYPYDLFNFYLNSNDLNAAEDLADDILRNKDLAMLKMRNLMAKSFKARIYYERGDLTKASHLADSLLPIVDRPSSKVKFHEILYRYYLPRDKSKALDHYKMKYKLVDQINHRQTINTIIDEEIAVVDSTFHYEIDQLDFDQKRLDASVRSEKSKEFYLILCVTIITTITVILLALFIKARRKKRILARLNKYLQIVVADRKNEYRNTLASLQKHHQSLDKFILIISHFLHSPVRLLSESLQLHYSESSDLSKEKIFAILNKPVEELLFICTLLNKILSNQFTSSPNESIDVREEIERITTGLIMAKSEATKLSFQLEETSFFGNKAGFKEVIKSVISDLLERNEELSKFSLDIKCFRDKTSFNILLRSRHILTNLDTTADSLANHKTSSFSFGEKPTFLFFAHALINLLGGSLIISSQHGYGSTIRLSFPESSGCINNEMILSPEEIDIAKNVKTVLSY